MALQNRVVDYLLQSRASVIRMAPRIIGGDGLSPDLMPELSSIAVNLDHALRHVTIHLDDEARANQEKETLTEVSKPRTPLNAYVRVEIAIRDWIEARESDSNWLLALNKLVEGIQEDLELNEEQERAADEDSPGDEDED